MSSEKDSIDVAKQLEAKVQERLKGERDTSALNSGQKRFVPGSKTFVWVSGGVGLILSVVVIYKTLQAKKEKDQPSPIEVIQTTVKKLNVKEEPLNVEPQAEKSKVLEQNVETIENKQDKNSSSKEPSPEELLKQRRLSSNLIDGEGNSSQNSQVSQEGKAIQVSSQEGELQQRMQPLRLQATTAEKLGDRHYLLTQGSMIDCILETRMITTQPGMTACYVSRDIYSANGRVLLIDRGSKIIGHYQGGITQGQARIFVLWSRIETPNGVIINLDSPGTGPLGEGGVGGYVDTHFWERFGGAILLSMIDDLSKVATERIANSNNKNQVNFSTTSNSAQDMAAEALKNSINIPPTLYKNQGERISIFVARDLDFRSVYELKPR